MPEKLEFWLVDDNEIDRVVNGRLIEAAFAASVQKFKDGPSFLEALAGDSGVEEDDLREGSALAAGSLVVLLTSMICKPPPPSATKAVLPLAERVTPKELPVKSRLPISDGLVEINPGPVRSQALKVIRSLIVPVKSVAGAKASRVLLSAYSTRAEVSDTAPISLQSEPLLME